MPAGLWLDHSHKVARKAPPLGSKCRSLPEILRQHGAFSQLVYHIVAAALVHIGPILPVRAKRETVVMRGNGLGDPVLGRTGSSKFDLGL
jgi:hypothetical protein